jgi:hypothetical protein
MYRVLWSATARDELTTIWLAADERRRRAITWALDDLDYRLSRAPGTEGESRRGSVRIAFERPLAILFEVDEDSRTVHIGHVGPYGR